MSVGQPVIPHEPTVDFHWHTLYNMHVHNAYMNVYMYMYMYMYSVSTCTCTCTVYQHVHVHVYV